MMRLAYLIHPGFTENLWQKKELNGDCDTPPHLDIQRLLKTTALIQGQPPSKTVSDKNNQTKIKQNFFFAGKTQSCSHNKGMESH